MMDTLEVGFLTSGDPQINPSARFRVYQFLPLLERNSTINVRGTAIINSHLSPVSLLRNLIEAILLAWQSDVLYVQKARLPRPVFRLFSLLSDIIYDFDDSTFLPPPSWKVDKGFESRRVRLDYSLRHSRLIIAGNEFLAAYARQYNGNVEIIPTVVTTSTKLPDAAYRWGIPPQVYTRRVYWSSSSDCPVVGWIGGGEHVEQLDQVLPALRALQRKYGIRIKVVSDRPWLPDGLEIDNKLWRLEEEVSDVQSFDIGLMPLDRNDPFLQGKCAFKAIEYMAVGTPAVASAVGANRQAIQHGRTGFLVNDPSEWEDYLTQLTRNRALRNELGDSARAWVQENYSLERVLPHYLELLTNLVSPGK